MMIFYQMRGRETTFQSPMVRVVLSRITLMKSVFFCRSFLYRKKKRRRKECVTHEIRITGIAWCKRKEGILRFPLFFYTKLFRLFGFRVWHIPSFVVFSSDREMTGRKRHFSSKWFSIVLHGPLETGKSFLSPAFDKRSSSLITNLFFFRLIIVFLN